MQALDGNAIAGQLYWHFGREMTAARGSCEHCGTAAAIGELAVYIRGPGSVVRCRHCGQVVMVLVDVGEETHVYANAFQLDRGSDAPGR